MSTQAPAAATPQLMDPDSAYALVHQRVYAPVFFEKLAADYGVGPANEAEAMEMMTMAAQLRLAHDTEQEKQASTPNSVLQLARQQLDTQLVARGHPAQPSRDSVLVKEAAVQASFDPQLATAVLSMQAAAAAA